ncbi:MAG TPA: cupin domain-containing protein [Gemmatimonadales bacterium]|jgi:quercetin dioxygenase-like cupin family protein
MALILTPMSDYFRRVEHSARFSRDRAAKADLWAGERLFVGLNCFEPGQTQPVHAHAGADKFYYVCSGRARLTVGEEAREVGPGEIVWAPAGVPHGVEAALERTILLVGIAPPPR